MTGAPAVLVREVRVPVAGRRAGRAPLTWAQRVQWNDTKWMEPYDHYFNAARRLAVPPGRELSDVTGLLAAVAARHESLRTRYPTDGDGSPYQEVSTADELVLEVCRTDGAGVDEAADWLQARLRARRFELSEEPPLRAAVLEHEGTPRYLLVVVSHVTMDFSGLELLTGELRELLSGRTTPSALPPVERQMLDQAEAEAAPAGRRRSEAALGHWERVLRDAPVTVFDPPGPTPPPLDGPERFGQLGLVSPALTLATRALAQRLGVSGTTVVMAAVNVVLCRLTGRARVPLKLIASNRGLTELKDLVGIALGSCVTLVHTEERTFPEVVRDTGRAALQAYRRSQCDPVALDELRSKVSAERGVDRVGLPCGFNDLRPARPAPGDGGATADAVRALLPRTEVTWDGNRPRQEVTLWYWVEDVDGVDVHHALVDLWYLPRARTEELLRGVEDVIVSAAVAGPSAG
ncbi:condensation domain-containing protein [Streptomyces sp. NPDC020731]|uniref:condensation domain-containing protein n=1 Tax=Streptomyces sp. NPDC020731 TaxID=3365085 RepID=UPI00379DF225